MGQSKLEQIAIAQRGVLNAINSYNNVDASNNYTATHTKALSDTLTPEQGRGSGGENYLDTPNQNVGTQTDIYGNPSIPGSGRKPAYANNGSTWGYTPDSVYQAPDTSGNIGQIVVD